MFKGVSNLTLNSVFYYVVFNFVGQKQGVKGSLKFSPAIIYNQHLSCCGHRFCLPSWEAKAEAPVEPLI